jgi:CD2 antigen cytoplasmic tail-binding protein 2
VTAFNLEEEEEDGYFDASGNYFENKKDDSHEGDNWLETAGQYVAKPKKAIVPNFAEPTADPEKRDRCNLLTGMLKHLQARETVQQAMRRLGGQPPSGQRRWKKKEAKGGASAAAAAAPSGVVSFFGGFFHRLRMSQLLGWGGL